MRPLHGRSPAAAPSRAWLYAAGVALFLVWGNGFNLGSFLLGGERAPARFDAFGLAVARFTLVSPTCLLFLLVFRRRQTLELLHRYPWRIAVAALLCAPAYCLALYSGQALGVPAPVASLTTALTPLFLMILAALFLGEPLSARKGIAFAIALSGLITIAWSRAGTGGSREAASYGLLIALTALAPLSWSIYSVLGKPAIEATSPIDWSYLTLGLGGLPLLAMLPWHGAQLAALDGAGWGAILYQSVLGTLGGYAVWGWLLRHLPASSIGFFTFLNPPLTAISKFLLASLFPAVFVWRTNGLEIVGAALALCGMALALARPRAVALPVPD